MKAQNEDEVLEELERRMAGYGNGKALAEKIGTSPIYLRSVKSRTQPLTQRIALELGFVLRWVRVGGGEDGLSRSE